MAVFIDLYERYNTVTDWGAVKANVDGVILKYSDGYGEAAVPAANYVEQCVKYDIPYTGYHFAEGAVVSAELETFNNALNKYGATLPFQALDYEYGTVNTNWAKAFCQQLKQPMVYSPSTWLQTMQPKTWGFPCYVWGAGSTEHYSGVYDLWQVAGTVPGITGSVDKDLVYNQALEASVMTDPMNDSIEVFDATGKQLPSVTVSAAIQNMYGMMFYGSPTSPWNGPSVVKQLKSLVESLAALENQVEDIQTVVDSLKGLDAANIAAAVTASFEEQGSISIVPKTPPASN